MNYLATIKTYQKHIIWITLSVFILSIALSFINPIEYRSTNRLLLVQPTDTTSDAYGVIKSVERTSESLSQVLYTTSFYDKVMATGFDIDKTYFKQDEKQKRKQWSKMISASVVRGSGMLQLDVYHTDPAQALELNRAIAYTLSLSGGLEYLGNRNIQIKEVDAPLVSKWPVRPNLLVNGILGIILGFIVGIAYAFLGKTMPVASQSYTAPQAPHQPHALPEEDFYEEPAAPAYNPHAIPDPILASEHQEYEEQDHYMDAETHYHEPSGIVDTDDQGPSKDQYNFSVNENVSGGSQFRMRGMYDYLDQ